MLYHVQVPVCPANAYLRHLTQYFVGKYTIIWVEARSIADWGFQIAEFSSERVCEGGAALEEHLVRGAAFKPFSNLTVVLNILISLR